MVNKNDSIRFKISTEEKNNLKAEAESKNVTMSKLIRSKLLKNYLNV